jgi:hypothetical protein
MLNLEQELLYEIQWRTGELSTLKILPTRRNLSEYEKQVLLKYSVVGIYSLWEGFVVQSFIDYIRELNNQNLTYKSVHLNLLAHDIDMKYKLRDSRINFDSKCKLIQNFQLYQNSPIIFSTEIPTESNVNYKVINRILFRFNLDPLDSEKFEKPLDKLLLFRNKIAHGESSVRVNGDTIQELSSTVIDSMHEVTTHIIDGYKQKKYCIAV